jgi:hypothetical protein
MFIRFIYMYIVSARVRTASSSFPSALARSTPHQLHCSTMAVYANIEMYKAALKKVEFGNRADYLYKVRFARIESILLPYRDQDSTKAIFFGQHFGFVASAKKCKCNAEWSLRIRSRAERVNDCSWFWRGPREWQDGCDACLGQEESFVKSTIFDNSPSHLWLKILDHMVMWCLEYPRHTMQCELDMDDNKTSDRWVVKLQAVCESAVEGKIMFPRSAADIPGARRRMKLKTTMKSMKCGKKVMKKPTKLMKRPAGQKIVKKPAKSTLPAARTRKIIVQIDEAHLNKAKPGKLSRFSRPKPDQVWVWGATIQGHPELFFFKVMKHVDDAYNGRPRGKEEILENFRELGLEKGKHIVVTDKWLGTVAAIKQLRSDNGWSEAQLRHEIVVHSNGEIVNVNGFTTNAIEARWSVIKRWIRKHLGGKLPGHSDRDKWTTLLTEFRYRKYVVATKCSGKRSLDDHSIQVVTFMKDLATHYKKVLRRSARHSTD